MGFQTNDMENQQTMTLQNLQYQAAIQQQYQNIGNVYQQPQAGIQLGGVTGVQPNMQGMGINGIGVEGTY